MNTRKLDVSDLVGDLVGELRLCIDARSAAANKRVYEKKLEDITQRLELLVMPAKGKVH